MKKTDRILAFLMSLVLCVSLLPVSAFAGEDGMDFTEAEVSEEPAAEELSAREEAATEEPALTEAVPAEKPVAVEENAAEKSTPAASDGQEGAEIHCVPDSATDDNDELFAEYVDHVFGTGDSSIALMSTAYAGDQLTGKEKMIYDMLKGWITEVANGERTSSVFYVPMDQVIEKRTFTAEELGVDEITEDNVRDLAYQALGVNQTAIMDALLADCAYELYWYDKMEGFWYGGFDYPYTATELTITGDNYRFRLTVSVDYAPEPYDVMGFTTDPAKTSAAIHAAANAREIVNAAAGLSDLEKLEYYCTWICDNVSYNVYAVVIEDYPYGDPWQLIWAFDNDPETDIVCEGYSKAFQYLCELTTFSTSIRSAIVLGYESVDMESWGTHMWNVVQLGNGKSYLVDVTNCDHVVNTTGLFLRPAGSGSVEGVYAVYNTYLDYDYNYAYDSSTLKTYPEDFLTLATEEIGDVNGDGKVNLLDLLTLKRALADGTEAELPSGADVNCDDTVNRQDLSLLKKMLTW